MSKLFAAIFAAMFALGTVSVFAAAETDKGKGDAKKEAAKDKPKADAKKEEAKKDGKKDDKAKK